jgi:hypothetical protein
MTQWETEKIVSRELRETQPSMLNPPLKAIRRECVRPCVSPREREHNKRDSGHEIHDFTHDVERKLASKWQHYKQIKYFFRVYKQKNGKLKSQMRLSKSSPSLGLGSAENIGNI